MAIAFGAATSSYADSTTTSHSHTASGSDRIALIGVFQHTDHTISSISYGAQTPTLIATVGRAHLYRQVAPNTGAQTVAVTSSASAGLILAVVSYTGVDQTTPIGTHQSAENTEQTSITTPTISSAVGELIVDLGVLIVDTGMTAGGGQTSRISLPEATHAVGYFSVGMSEKAGASSVTTSWSAAFTVGDNIIIGVPLIPAAGGGSSQAPRSSAFMQLLINN
jgi:hypothetical protein